MANSLIDTTELPDILEMDQEGKIEWLVTKVHLLNQRLDTIYKDWQVMAPDLKTIISEWKTIKTKAVQGVVAAIFALVGINIFI